MAFRWERYLEKWTGAGLIDASAAERIRVFEASHENDHGLRWPVLLAVSLGGLLLCSGVLLFVAAHWDSLSPSMRFGLVLGLVAVFHISAALTSEHFPALSTTFHAVGTACLGAGIFLAGQIFHLQEHWPGGVMLWAFGAWIAWALLRDWVQAGFVAILMPVWLGGEWSEATNGLAMSGKILAQALLFLSISYLTAVVPGKENSTRKVLMWIGGLSLIPLAAAVPVEFIAKSWQPKLPQVYLLLGGFCTLTIPLGLSWLLRGRATWANGIAAVWIIFLGLTDFHFGGSENLLRSAWHDMGPYVLWALGALLLIAWGLLEARKERVNLGIAGFALTVLAFYFSSVMDKLDRAASLITLGLLFVLGGWLLEKTRRRLVAKIERERS
jgi:uncharacterized membrane protein